MDLKALALKASTSKKYLWLLNLGLNRMIPFNRPHGIRVEQISAQHIQTFIPYKKKNLNHIKGIHACAMATLAEFTCGFLLISKLDPRAYRLILKTLSLDYHYQGKMDVYGSFEITEDWLTQHVYSPLQNAEATDVTCIVKITDKQANHLATATAVWQIKDWKKVKTKVE